MKKALKIVVLAKQVPDTRNVGKDAMTPEGTVNRAALPAIFNPEDLNALEMALALKDRTEGSTVHILTMGPQRAADIIRDAMFRGADGGYLLTGREFAGSDTLATSYALSCALKMIAPDIIFAGRQAIDGDTAQVGPQVAEKLGLPQVTYAEEITEIKADSLVIKRRLNCGMETVETPVPVVVTVNASAPECRPRNAKRVMTCKFALAKSEIAAAPRLAGRQARRRQGVPADRRVGRRRRQSRSAAAGPCGFAHQGQEDRERGVSGQGGQETHVFRRGYQFTDGRTYREPHARLNPQK